MSSMKSNIATITVVIAPTMSMIKLATAEMMELMARPIAEKMEPMLLVASELWCLIVGPCSNGDAVTLDTAKQMQVNTLKISLPYDVNFCFHVPHALGNDRVKLIPFVPTIHAAEFYAKVCSSPHVYDYLPYGPFQTLEDYHQFLEARITTDPGTVLFAVYDTSQENDLLAGCIAYLNSSAPQLTAEIGHMVTLPAFQRSHVTSNAVGLLLRYALDPPSAGGLGLRRVLWKANAFNERSIKAAQRMGFRSECIIRWDRVLPLGKENAGNGNSVRVEDPKRVCVGRDTMVLGFCWDVWQDARQHVDDVMARNM